jgi:sulfate adenylyltransferase subunit 1 (EFTu-like GTPase family)
METAALEALAAALAAMGDAIQHLNGEARQRLEAGRARVFACLVAGLPAEQRQRITSEVVGAAVVRAVARGVPVPRF